MESAAQVQSDGLLGGAYIGIMVGGRCRTNLKAGQDRVHPRQPSTCSNVLLEAADSMAGGGGETGGGRRQGALPLTRFIRFTLATAAVALAAAGAHALEPAHRRRAARARQDHGQLDGHHCQGRRDAEVRAAERDA